MPADSEQIRDQIRGQVLTMEELLEQAIKKLFTTDQYKTYLRCCDRFYNYSFNNQVLIAEQRPDATLVAGRVAFENMNFQTDEEVAEKMLAQIRDNGYEPNENEIRAVESEAHRVNEFFSDPSHPDKDYHTLQSNFYFGGRTFATYIDRANCKVKESELDNGIRINTIVREKEINRQRRDADGNPVLDENGNYIYDKVKVTLDHPYFKTVYVWDISQTEGAKMPERPGTRLLTDDVENYNNIMDAIQKLSPVPIRFGTIKGTANGYYDPQEKEIVIRAGLGEAQIVKTAIHEAMHARIHDPEQLRLQGRSRVDQITRETEAESAAFLVCDHFGIDTSDYTFPYVAAWASSIDLKELKNSMGIIANAATDFIIGMDEQLAPERLEHQNIVVHDDAPEVSEQEGMSTAEAMEQAVERGAMAPEQQAAVRTAVPGPEQELNGRAEEKDVEDEADVILYEQVRLFGVPVLYSNDEIADKDIPEGMYRYDLRTSDADPYGPPATIEEQVVVNREGTILSPVRIPFLENGNALNISEEFNTVGSFDITVDDFRASLTGVEYMPENMSSVMGKNIIRSNESVVLDSGRDRTGEGSKAYAIYQIRGDSPYKFEGTNFMDEHGLKVNVADYDVVYGGIADADDTPESLFEVFNLYRPTDFNGHSMSVSDIVVIDGENGPEAFYCDSMGFTPMPEFIRQREELNEAKEYINEYTLSEFEELDGAEFDDLEHVPLAFSELDNGDPIQAEADLVHFRINKFTVSNDEPAETRQFGSLRDMIDNGLRGLDFVDLTRLSEEPKQTEEIEPEQEFDMRDIPVYYGSPQEAEEAEEADEYRASFQADMECRRGINDAVHECFDGFRLNPEGAESIVREYGPDRTEFVLAAMAHSIPNDGRILPDVRAWAASVIEPGDLDDPSVAQRWQAYNADIHPAVLNGFIRQAQRESERVREEEQEFNPEEKADAPEVSKPEPDEEQDIDNDDLEEKEETTELVIDNNTSDLIFKGHKGNWRVTNSIERNGDTFFLAESDSEEESMGFIIDRKGYIVLYDVPLDTELDIFEDSGILGQLDDWSAAEDKEEQPFDEGPDEDESEEPEESDLSEAELLSEEALSDLAAAEEEQRHSKDEELICAESKLDAMIEKFANAFDRLSYKFDPFNYEDVINDSEQHIEEIISDVELSDTEAIEDDLSRMAESEDEEVVEGAYQLSDDLNDIQDLQEEIDAMRNSVTAETEQSVEASEGIIIAKFVYETKSGEPSQIIITESEKGFFNYFDFDEDLKKGLFYNGPFDSLSDARQNIKQHEPSAQEISIYGSDMPLYSFSYEHANEADELSEYSESCKQNVECKAAIEGIATEEYSGLSGSKKKEAVKELVNQFGSDRVEYVLANSVDKRSKEPGIIDSNKNWAQNIKNSKTVDLTEGCEPGLFSDASAKMCVVNSPAEALNQLIVSAREEVLEVNQEKTQEKENDVNMERKFCALENAEFCVFGDCVFDTTIDDAINAYLEYSEEMGKGLGVSVDGNVILIAISGQIVFDENKESNKKLLEEHPEIKEAIKKFKEATNEDKEERDKDRKQDDNHIYDKEPSEQYIKERTKGNTCKCMPGH